MPNIWFARRSIRRIRTSRSAIGGPILSCELALRPFQAELVISDTHHIVAQQQFLILSFVQKELESVALAFRSTVASIDDWSIRQPRIIMIDPVTTQ